MKKKSLIDTYLQNYSVGEKWELTANNTDNISQVVVIPAYAEKDMLFSTLASLAENSPPSLEHSFLMCVVNNADNDTPDVKENNLRTIEYLDALIRNKSFKRFADDSELYPLLSGLSAANLKLGYIDASSGGCEIPQDTAGVGMARKIGMDMALRLLKNSSSASNLIISLDADTLVQSNYLSAIRKYFTPGVKTAILAYEHQMPEDIRQQAAIYSYEIFLRYWILGLEYAKSPWAFHSIGSTIVTTTEAYLGVRGMNKRKAGEDFYFLSKLAKAGKIDYIKETSVYPSARVSTRVPFGTGKRIERFLSGNCREEYLLYDPRIFKILAEWLLLMKNQFICGEDEILLKAQQIHPRLKHFLQDAGFQEIWSKISRSAKDKKTLLRQFNDWFDGFKTLKLINYFTKDVYPMINMFNALEEILFMSGIELKLNYANEIPSIAEQMRILQYLRTIT
jgi:glycosyltransferase involved in cell wall biosynthesis